MTTPEAIARIDIDAALERAGWALQDADQTNLFACRGVAIREFPLKTGHGEADYLLFVDGKTIDANFKRAERLRQAILQHAFWRNECRRSRPMN